MSLFGIFWWLVFGAVVGWLAKALHPGKEEVSGLGTIGMGVLGSFVGGFINWLLGWGESAVSGSGFIMSLLGAVLCFYVYANKDGIRSWVEQQINRLGGK